MQPQSSLAQEHAAINQLLASLDEKARRQCAGLLALQHGRGGITHIAEITGLSRNTIRRGQSEIQYPAATVPKSIRHPGGGRKRIEKKILRL
jgi:DNA-binding phage protein